MHIKLVHVEQGAALMPFLQGIVGVTLRDSRHTLDLGGHRGDHKVMGWTDCEHWLTVAVSVPRDLQGLPSGTVCADRGVEVGKCYVF